MKSTSLFTFFGAVCALALSPSSQAAPNAKGDSLVYCSEASPSNFNPQISTDGPTYNTTKAIYNRLVEFQYGGTRVEPALATSWKISKDGKSYIFSLRKEVKFHTTAAFKPTRPFNADDVLFSFNRQRLADHPYHRIGGGIYEYFDSMEMQNVIQDIRKIDDYTVEFKLKNPEAPFLANLAMDFASILSKEYADQLMKAGKPDQLDFQPVGTGPFQFVRYDKDQQIRFTANKDYFRGKPSIDKLVFSITPDPNVRIQKLRTGECQFATEPSPADLRTLASVNKVKLMSEPGLNVGYLAFNVEKKPFDNLLVRQAIQYALNRKAYIDPIYLGNAVVAKNPIPPTLWSYNDKVQDYDFNPEKSKALLKQAGYPNGFETELWTLPVSRPYLPNGKKLGELMQADLARVGIKVKLVSYDWPTYLSKSKMGEHTLLQMGWTGDNGDPDNFLNVLLSCAAVKGGSNRARWCNKDFDALIQKARVTSNQKLREQYYREAQVIFKREAPWVTLAHSRVFRALDQSLQGYKIDPFGSDFFYPVSFRPVGLRAKNDAQ